jgi:hypothetical protein
MGIGGMHLHLSGSTSAYSRIDGHDFLLSWVGMMAQERGPGTCFTNVKVLMGR